MISIRTATTKDIPLIQQIANITWHATYSTIVSKIQLDFMLDLFYSTKILTDTINQDKNLFLIAFDGDRGLGFAGIEYDYQNKLVTRLHKLYVLPEAQGKQIGKKLIDASIDLALKNKNKTISLNVNRYNSARLFYLKMGFEVIQEVDIVLEHDYLMEDFVMEKSIIQ